MLKVLDKLPKIFGHIYTILLVLVSWVIFAFEDLGQIGTYLSTMFGLNGTSFANAEAIYYLKNLHQIYQDYFHHIVFQTL